MRISVSDVDQYLYYMRDEDMTLDELLRRLRRETPKTESMLAGTAFHRFLETAALGEVADFISDGFRFRLDLDAEVSLPRIRELKGIRHYGPVDLVGVVDAIHGSTVYDHKLSGRFDPERYTDAFQWRAYIAMFKADKFVYNVFTAKKDGDAWAITALDTLPLYRYDGLERDVERTLNEFVQFANQHLPERAA